MSNKNMLDQLEELGWHHKPTKSGRDRWILDGAEDTPYYALESFGDGLFQIDSVYAEPLMRFYGHPFTARQIKSQTEKLRKLGRDYFPHMDQRGVHAIWMEGYAATGEHETADLIGYYCGETFDDAVREFIETDYNEKGWGTYEPPERLGGYGKYHTIWGCALYDNEKDARKGFG